MPKIRKVMARDGAKIDFDGLRIAESIFRAAASVGEGDREVADELAGVVTLFLEKRSEGASVHVAEIEDMIERVLLETGHVETARAYIRMRGDREAPPKKGADSAPGELFPELGVSVLSADGCSISAWDRGRIEADLRRETGLGAREASETARAVESKILPRCSGPVSSALVRALVDAELFDRGRVAEISRRRVLGVPAPEFGEMLIAGGAAASPGGAVHALSGRAMRQFAFGEVFSRETAAAHAECAIHVEHSDSPLHVAEAFLPLEYVKRFGPFPFGGGAPPEPPEGIAALAAGLGSMAEGLAAHVCSGVDFGYVNLSMAPLLDGVDDAAVEEAAAAVLSALSGGGRPGGIKKRMNVSAGVPDLLRFTEARGPGGRRTGRGFGEYWTAAEKFARALAVRASDPPEAGGGGSRIAVHVDANTFKNPSALSLLRFFCRRTGPGFSPLFVFEREPSLMSVHSRLLPRAGNPDLFRNPERMRLVLVQSVAVNAIRAAAVSGPGRMEEFCRLIESGLRSAVRALAERKKFVLKLSKAGLYGAIEQDAPDSAPFLAVREGLCGVSMTGLIEASTLVSAGDAEIQRLLPGAVSFLLIAARDEARKASIPLVFGGDTSMEALGRFRNADPAPWAAAAAACGGGPCASGAVLFGLQVHEMHEKVRMIGSKLSTMERRLCIAGLLGNPDNPPEGFFDLVCDVYENTDVVFLRFI